MGDRLGWVGEDGIERGESNKGKKKKKKEKGGGMGYRSIEHFCLNVLK